MITKNLEQTHSLAGDFLKSLKSNKMAIVILLYGDLGSGKTSFVQGIAKRLGLKDNIISPTFVIEKIYKLPKNQKFKQLIHIDAYRLDSYTEMLALGWNDILKNPDNLIFIEWPERIKEILPKGAKKIFFTFLDEQRRMVEIK